jgi:hypothetical protein
MVELLEALSSNPVLPKKKKKKGGQLNKLNIRLF